ncbi:MAG: MotA/TolQ/ExbB proton channel family protein, partial [Gammaproteobacteria bacterium]
LWSLQTKRETTQNLVSQEWQWFKKDHLDAKSIQSLKQHSPLGRILAAGLMQLRHDRQIMKESIEDVGRHVVQDLERYLNTLGTIAAVSPLLGLLGTVTGMIRAFSAISEHGVSDPAVVSGGIAEALITTAAGLIVAIPALMAYRYLRGRVDALVVSMEQEALKLVEVIHGDREGTDLHYVGLGR